MRALTWQGNEHVEVTDVPDPEIQEPNDIIIRVTSSPATCSGTSPWASSRRLARTSPICEPETE